MANSADDLAQARAAFSGCDADMDAAFKLAARLSEVGVWNLGGKVELGLYLVAQTLADVREKRLTR